MALDLNSTKDFFIAPCFRNGGGTDLLEPCVTSSIAYYTDILVLLVGVTSFVYLVYGGFMMFSAFGDESKYARAKKTVTFAVIGLSLAICATLIINWYITFLGYNPNP